MKNVFDFIKETSKLCDEWEIELERDQDLPCLARGKEKIRERIGKLEIAIHVFNQLDLAVESATDRSYLTRLAVILTSMKIKLEAVVAVEEI